MLAVLVAVLASGCGGSAAREDAAATTAERFRSALAADNGAAACVLLAPQTRREVEQTTDQACASAVVGQDIPAARSPARAVEVYGDLARVSFGDDTLFLAAFTAGWRVTAAGCTPRGERPYECTVKGA